MPSRLRARLIDQKNTRRDLSADLKNGARRAKVRRRHRAGVDEQNAVPLLYDRSVKVSKHDDVAAGKLRDHCLVEHIELRGLVAAADVQDLEGVALVAMMHADAAAVEADRGAFRQLPSDFRRVAIAGDRQGRGDGTQRLEDWQCNEISRVNDALDAGEDADERFGKVLQSLGNMGIRDESDAHRVVRHAEKTTWHKVLPARRQRGRGLADARAG